MSKSIRLSPKHGLNPSLSQCFYCGGDKNELIIPGKMKGDREAPRKAVWNTEPCDKCKGYMAQGVILIGIDEAKTTDMKNPYRTGHFAVVKDRAFDVINEPLRSDILKKRVAFLPLDAWQALGLPMEDSA